MKRIGESEAGCPIVELSGADKEVAQAAIQLLSGILFGARAPDASRIPSFVASLGPKKYETPPARAPGGPTPKTGIYAKAHKCRRCDKPRESTPWPRGGALCLECSRIMATERYRRKKLAAAPVKPSVPKGVLRALENRERSPVLKSPAEVTAERAGAPGRVVLAMPPLHGTDRIRAAMQRLPPPKD